MFLGRWLRALNTYDRVFALEGCTWWWGRWAVHRSRMRLGGRAGRNVIFIDGRLCKKTFSEKVSVRQKPEGNQGMYGGRCLKTKPDSLLSRGYTNGKP